MDQTKNWPGKAPQRVVCAANRYIKDHDYMLVGPRHWDKTMRSQNAGYPEFVRESIEWEQGFIDQFGDFLTRQEAWVIANEQGQIIRRCGGDSANGGTLYSENLY